MARFPRLVTVRWCIVLIVLVAVCNCKQLINPYIQVPFQELDYGMRDTGRLYLALKSLSLKPDSRPEFVLDKLREFRDRSDYKLDREDMDRLIGLADKSDECNYGQYEVFMKSFLIAKRTRTIEGSEAILNFLRHYGRSKYSRCAKRVLAEFNEKLRRNAADLRAINQFYATALGLRPRDQLETILEGLKKFKLAESDVNMSGLAMLSERNLPAEPGPAGRVLAKLTQTCDRLVRSFDMDFNILNLAILFNPDGEDYFKDNVELQTLNEIHRICLESESNKSAVLKNFLRQAKARHEFLDPIMGYLKPL